MTVDVGGKVSGKTTATEFGVGVRDGGKELHPFESHPRTPSGLKKSIKRREARHGGR